MGTPLGWLAQHNPGPGFYLKNAGLRLTRGHNVPIRGPKYLIPVQTTVRSWEPAQILKKIIFFDFFLVFKAFFGGLEKPGHTVSP